MKALLMAGMLCFLLLAGAGVVAAMDAPVVDADMTLAELAHLHDLRGGDVAEILGLPRQVDKQQTLRDLGVSEQDAQMALASAGVFAAPPEADRHRGDGQGRGDGRGRYAAGGDVEHPPELQVIPDLYNYLLWPVVVLGALWWLARGGRVAKGRLLPVPERYKPLGFYATLLLTVLFFGFASGKSPNPMEGLVKYVKALAGFYDDPWIKLGFLVFFSILAVVGTKLVCGWACPFGALQELFYVLPLTRRLKKWRLPFALTMTVRTVLFALFVFFAFGLAGHRWVIFHGVNPFNLFGFEFTLASIGVSVAVSLLLSLVIYRPFCQLVCPFGWFSWFLEKISLLGVRIDRQACVDCGACDKACPMETARQRRQGHNWSGECFSCARCLRVCPVDAIDYGPRWRSKPAAEDAAPTRE